MKVLILKYNIGCFQIWYKLINNYRQIRSWCLYYILLGMDEYDA